MNLKISVICPFPVEGQLNQQALFYNFKWNKMTLCKRIYAMTKTFFTGSYKELAWHMLGTWKHILKWKEIFDFNVPWNFQSMQTCLATLKKKKPIYFACFHKRETTFFFWITKRFAQNQWNSLAWFWLILSGSQSKNLLKPLAIWSSQMAWYSVYICQTLQGGKIPWEAPIAIVTWPFNHMIWLDHVTK